MGKPCGYALIESTSIHSYSPLTRMGSGARVPGSKLGSTTPKLTVCPGINFPTSLCLGLLIYKMSIITFPVKR